MQLVQDPGHSTSGIGVMRMGNSVPTVGIKSTSLAFWDSVLSITPPRLPDVTILPIHACLGDALSKRSAQITTLLPLELYISESLHCLLLLYVLSGRECLQLHTYQQ